MAFNTDIAVSSMRRQESKVTALVRAEISMPWKISVADDFLHRVPRAVEQNVYAKVMVVEKIARAYGLMQTRTRCSPVIHIGSTRAAIEISASRS